MRHQRLDAPGRLPVPRAHRRRRRARLEKNIALQNRCGVPHAHDRARARRASWSPSSTLDAASSPPATTRRDGIVFPWPFLWGYARAAAKRGVAIHTQTPVTAIERGARRRLPRCATPRGHAAPPARGLRGRRLVAARSRGWSGVDAARPPAAPRDPVDRAAEAVPEADGVGARRRASTVSQSMRGEIVGRRHAARRRRDATRQVRLGSRLAFVDHDGARAGRADAACSATSRSCASGPAPTTSAPTAIRSSASRRTCPASTSCCGFLGHGFMMAPVVARHCAAHLPGEAAHAFFSAWRAARFADRRLPPRAAARHVHRVTKDAAPRSAFGSSRGASRSAGRGCRSSSARRAPRADRRWSGLS